MATGLLLLCLVSAPHGRALTTNPSRRPAGVNSLRDHSFVVWIPEGGGRKSERESNISVRGTRMKIALVQFDKSGGPQFIASTIAMSALMTRRIPARSAWRPFAMLLWICGKVASRTNSKSELGNLKGSEYSVVTRQGLVACASFPAARAFISPWSRGPRTWWRARMGHLLGFLSFANANDKRGNHERDCRGQQ